MSDPIASREDGPRAEPWHARPVAEVLDALASSAELGLTHREVEARLRREGANRIEGEQRAGALALLARQFRSVLVLLLVAAAAVSLALGEGVDAVAILAILLVNAVLGFVQEFEAGRALDALQALTAPQATVIRDGRTSRIAADGLVRGDVIVLEAGDQVPADARVIAAAALMTNEAALTGESFPVTKDEAPVDPGAVLPERHSLIYAGTLVVAGRGRGVVTGTGATTELGRIADLVASAQQRRTPLESAIDRAGRWLGAGALASALLVFLVGIALGSALFDAFLVAVALAVAAVPEGLPAAITIVLALGVRRMARRRAIVRRLAAVETLGSTTVICTDKTGTLTANELSVQRAWWAAPGAPAGDTYGPDALAAGVPAGVTRCAALAVGQLDEGLPADPTDIAIARLATADTTSESLAADFPFDADRKRSSRVYATAEGTLLATKGAPEAVLERCGRMLVGETERPLDDADRTRVAVAVDGFAADGLRPIALAWRRLEGAPPSEHADPDALERDLTLVAVVGLVDAIRPGINDAIAAARSAGIRTVMITGDHPATAQWIAREAGIAPAPVVLTGRELAALEDEAFAARLEQIDVYARVTSEDKLRIVRAWKDHGDVVAMTGDGVNDTPALSEADVGVAMGASGTDAARAAADLVLADDDYGSIVAAVEEGRTIFANIRRFLMYLVAANAAEILVVLLGGLGRAAPLLPVQILWVNLVTDGPPALALGVEPAEPDTMRHAPRVPGSGVLTRAMLPRIALSTALIAGATLAAFVIGSARDGLEQARAFAFGTLVLTQLLAALTFRSETIPLHRLGLRGNLALLATVLVTLAIQGFAFYFAPLRDLLGARAFSPGELLVIGGLALPSLVVPEVVKTLRQRARRADR